MSWWKYAKPGDKVVCVDHPKQSSDGIIRKLTIGRIYEIEAISDDPYFTTSGVIGFYILGEYEGSWGSNLFRPLQTKSTETGMKILRKIAEGERVGA